VPEREAVESEDEPMMGVQKPVRKTPGEHRPGRVNFVKAWVSRAFFAFSGRTDIPASRRADRREARR